MQLLRLHSWMAQHREQNAQARRPEDATGINGHGVTTLVAQMEAFERSLLEQSLARHPRNVKQVATELRLKQRTLYTKLRHHDLVLSAPE